MSECEHEFEIISRRWELAGLAWVTLRFCKKCGLTHRLVQRRDLVTWLWRPVLVEEDQRGEGNAQS